MDQGHPMERKLRGALALFIMLACVSAYVGYRWVQSGSRTDAMAAVLEWGRLAPFPESAEQLTITPEGSMFTRAFRVQFIAPPDVINQWLLASPGIGVIEGDTPQPHVRYFRIVPGGGAQGAEAEVDDVTHTVKVYVYWS